MPFQSIRSKHIGYQKWTIRVDCYLHGKISLAVFHPVPLRQKGVVIILVS